ncbi:MAG TPA: hypothetical protein ENJ19_07560, partial [Gammaproteobacteria bacterium]|nr:hypothetical protein [Gammaproteobacteria bacterium]
MFKDLRQHTRLPIPKYYARGIFHLINGDQEYHYVRANDVCVSGVGLDLPSKVKRGSEVKLRYTSPDWRTELSGTVMWCERDDRVGVSLRAYENYRVGVRLNPVNA